MKNIARCLLRAGALVGSALVLGCSPTPSFTEAPGAEYRLPLPAFAHGVWTGDIPKDNGLRVRLVRIGEDELRFEFFSTRPGEELPPDLRAHTLRFAAMDWLAIDLSHWQEIKDGKDDRSKFVFVRFVAEGPDRVCAEVPGTRAFADAIDAGALQGKVNRRAPGAEVLVTSPAQQWLSWWSNQPAAAVPFSPEQLCFKRVSKG